MEIISHRGCWNHKEQQNTVDSLYNSLLAGYGFETDIRDFNKNIVISHDCPGPNELSLIDLFKSITLNKSFSNKTIALNVKSDGLSGDLANILKDYDDLSVFFFDMSVPDSLSYINNELPIFIRLSEYESDEGLLNYADGIWLDSFKSRWYTESLINKINKRNKKICFVSPELHGRNHLKFWQFLRGLGSDLNYLLCTDFPFEADSFFNGANFD